MSRSYAGYANILESEFGTNEIDGVQFFPAEELDFLFDGLSAPGELQDFGVRLAAKMAVGGSRLIDRIFEPELADYGRRSQVEDIPDLDSDLGVGIIPVPFVLT